jgi:triphosphatase
METTYYDTPGKALSSRRVTLRRRMENGRSICTVKTPAHGGARGEWELECDFIENSIPLLCKLGAPKWIAEAVAEGLVPVCGAVFSRQACQIGVDGAAVEIAVDFGRLFGGTKQLPLCEIEVEYKSGDKALAAAFADQLATRFGLEKENDSKFRRALSLAEGE